MTWMLGATVVGNLSYAYDPDGRVIEKTGSLATSGLPTAMSGNTFNAANERMGLDPAFNAAMKARLNASDHPFGELIKWHKEQSALSRFGDDRREPPS